MSDNVEIWKPVVGYEGLYEVSSFGRVRSLDRLVNRRNGSFGLKKGKTLKPHINRLGYKMIGLSMDGKCKHYMVHRLVAQAFIPNTENNPCVDHINTDKTDNTVCLNEDGSVNYEKTNLRWCTQKENNNNPLTKEKRGEALRKSHTKKVQQFTKDGIFINEWNSIIGAARELKINASGIWSCCNGRNRCKSYGGYVWRYKN